MDEVEEDVGSPVQEKLLELEARLIEQDHRPVAVIAKFLTLRRETEVGDPRRGAALRALLFSPASVAIGGSTVAVATLTVLVWQSLLVQEQNGYLREQIKAQQKQIDAQKLIDDQTIRNRAVEQVFGPEFARRG